MSRADRSVFDSFFWFQWIIATTLGWVLGSLLLPFIWPIGAGVGVGAMQWPVLYHRLPRAWRWPVATAVAWIAISVPLLIAVPADMRVLLGGVILGPIVGLAQWLILRHRVHWAGWWIVISAIAWITGLILVPDPTLVPGLVATGATSGALTGLALTLLFRYPKPVETPQGSEKSTSQEG
jgi:hypothetical protein